MVTDPSTSTTVLAPESYAASPLKVQPVVFVPPNALRLVPQTPVEQVPAQTPPVQTSPEVQELLSLQAVPLLASGLEHVPVEGVHVPATWHWSDAVQVTGFEPVQVPPTQVSVCVHRLSSLQAVPSETVGLEHVPVEVSHVPAAWHWSDAVQVTGFEPVQVPPTQVSVCVHRLSSLQAVPSETVGLEHAPVEVLHVPAAWHWSDAVQVTGFEPVQVPPTQVSVCVHRLLSLQAVPSETVGLEHTPVEVLHVPATWHWSCAAQVTGFEPVQVPPTQVSVCVHGLLSLQVVPSLFAA